jgi:O-acetyl-ADP-ribose deacetylase (regulator of RNase III)
MARVVVGFEWPSGSWATLTETPRCCNSVAKVRVGHMFVTENKELVQPRWIINFPTKKHWRGDSKIEWIHDGLRDLVQVIKEKKIRSIALPPLGCGNGGLRQSHAASGVFGDSK